jgi:hypothetical protein
MISFCGCTSAPVAKVGGDKGTKLDMPFSARTKAVEYQDKKYGSGYRVFNNGRVGIRCSVCLRIK